MPRGRKDEWNTTRVLAFIKERGQATKNEAAEFFDLTVPQKIAVFRILLEKGLLETVSVDPETCEKIYRATEPS